MAAAAVLLLAAAGCSSRPLPFRDAASVDLGTAGGGGGGDARDAPPVDARDASLADASPSDVASFVPTEVIVAASQLNVFCGLKAGRLKCWSDLDFLVNIVEPALAKAPPDLVQLAMSEAADSDPLFCGIDVRGQGTCWGRTKTQDLGSNVKAVAISRYGTCAVRADGSVTCTVLRPPSPAHRYVSIAASADFTIGLDDTGMPRPEQTYHAFPAAVYTRIAMNGGAVPAALRSDGVIVRASNPPMEFSGPFRDLTFDLNGHLCGVLVAGDVRCFSVETWATAPVTPPAGPFVQIVGGERALCALRRGGTTSCWGEKTLVVPDGW